MAVVGGRSGGVQLALSWEWLPEAACGVHLHIGCTVAPAWRLSQETPSALRVGGGALGNMGSKSMDEFNLIKIISK